MLNFYLKVNRHTRQKGLNGFTKTYLTKDGNDTVHTELATANRTKFREVSTMSITRQKISHDTTENN